MTTHAANATHGDDNEDSDAVMICGDDHRAISHTVTLYTGDSDLTIGAST